jgi:heme-degrading monooxygenase HmoA
MHARVITANVYPGNLDALVGAVQDSVMPEARKQQGFKGALLLTDAKAGRVIYVSLWEGEDDLKASETSGYVREQLAKTTHLLATPPLLATFEVSVREQI